MAYAKLFVDILDSTIWQESKEVRLLWITMLAMANRHGEVRASVPGLAKRAGLELDETVKALDELSSPDSWSRTDDYQGRRIERLDGGWLILNYEKHRARKDAEEMREQARVRAANYRERKKTSRDSSRSSRNITVSANPSPSPEPEPNNRTTPTLTGGGLGEGEFTGTATIYLQAYNRVFRKKLRTVEKIQKMLNRRKAYSDHELQILPFLIPTYTPRPGAPFTLHQPHVYLRDGEGREPFEWVTNLLNHATEAVISRWHAEIAKDMGLWPTLTALGAKEAPKPKDEDSYAF